MCDALLQAVRDRWLSPNCFGFDAGAQSIQQTNSQVSLCSTKASPLAATPQAALYSTVQTGVVTVETRLVENGTKQRKALELITAANGADANQSAKANPSIANAAACNTAKNSAEAQPTILADTPSCAVATEANKTQFLHGSSSALREASLSNGMSCQPDVSPSSVPHYTSSRDHGWCSVQQIITVPTPADATACAAQFSAASPAVSIDGSEADLRHSALDLFSMISNKGTQCTGSPADCINPDVVVCDSPGLPVHSTTSHSMQMLVMAEQTNHIVPMTAAEEGMLTATAPAAASETASTFKDSDCFTSNTQLGNDANGLAHDGRHDDVAAVPSKRRLSAGTERRVHVAEQLRQMLPIIPEAMGANLSMVSSCTGFACSSMLS